MTVTIKATAVKAAKVARKAMPVAMMSMVKDARRRAHEADLSPVAAAMVDDVVHLAAADAEAVMKMARLSLRQSAPTTRLKAQQHLRPKRPQLQAERRTHFAEL